MNHYFAPAVCKMNLISHSPLVVSCLYCVISEGFDIISSDDDALHGNKIVEKPHFEEE